MDLKKICRGCFREKPEVDGTCPYCGFNEIKYERERDPEVLPLNTVLQGKYVIGRCLGRGGFGITYMGWHMNLDTVVAIKEFFPSGIVSRDTGNPDRTVRTDVTMVNTGSTKAYRKSLDGFIKEAKTLGGLRLPGVVLVHDFFEENRTAYIVMDYVEGENLSLWLKHSGGKLPETQVLKLIHPLTGSLQKLHEKGIIHRDISPDNLILQPDGSIMLVDFGAARTVMLEQEAEKAAQSMTVVLKPGYAPIEQYSSHGHQGPWTDVYAFCATIFRMLTGAAPADPSTRAVRDDDEEMLRASLESAGVSQKTINALMKGMQLRPQNRCQSMRELEEALYGTEETGTETHVGGRGTQQPQAEQEPVTPEKEPVQTGRKTNRGLITAALIGVLVLAAAIIGFTVHSRNSKRQETVERVSEAETQKVSEKDYTETAKYEEATYTLTVENGTGTGTYHTGDRVSITADEKEGYEFSSWKVEKGDISIEGTSLSKATVIVGEEDAKVEAVYAEQAYTVTVNGGSIVGGKNGQKYKPGTSITIKADVAEGYSFSTWNVDSGDITLTDPSAEQITFVMGNEDVEIAATVEAVVVETEKAINAEFIRCEEGDIISFGTYEQDNTANGSEPIEWLILEKEDDKMLVISKYGLDAKAYHEKGAEVWLNITWENCTLRHWLNDAFYQTAFNDEEKNIIAGFVKTQRRSEYGTDDKVFLLDIWEARELFADDEARKCDPTEYAIKQGAKSTGTCYWWLRCNNCFEDYGAIVSNDGTVINAFNVYSKSVCVRPALWIKLPELKEDESSDKAAGVKITEEIISKVQAALNASGYDCGTPDGKAGPKTIAALNAYQTDNGLEITSTITQTDINALGVE